MKLTITQKNIYKALSLTERVVTKNASLPILNNVLIKTENGRLKIAATNLEIGITCFVGAKIDEPGEITLPAKILTDFISAITDEKIILSTKQSTMSIVSDKYKTQILGVDPKDFPIIPKIKTQPFCKIESSLLKEILVSVADSVAGSETRPELSGVFLKFKKDKIICASTDSFRLSERVGAIKASEEKSVILPKNTVSELIRITNEVGGSMEVRVGENQISFSSDDCEVISRLIDGVYPDYQKIIPEKSLSQILVKKDELEKNTRLAGIFSSRISDVKISSSKDVLTITAQNSEKGEVEAKMPIVLKNDPFEVSLNYHYLLDGLKHISSEHVIIEFTGDGSPLVIKPSTPEKLFTYIIMPLRQS